MTDGDRLQRFVDAQAADGAFARAVAELRRGRKRSHWMWFVFPQLAGLGRSATAQHFAIASLDEARAYLHHPLLGARLRECCDALLTLSGTSAAEVFGDLDALKLRSSMTLFAAIDPQEPRFVGVLERYFDGQSDPLTAQLLEASGQR